MITMGTVMEIDSNKALVFTMDGSVGYIKPRLGLFVGQQVAFTRREIVTHKKKLLAALPFAALAAAVVAVVFLAAGFFGAGGFGLFTTQQCTAYIALDINPSIQFKIDEDGTVIGSSALNADGRTLLESFNPNGKPIDKAVDEAITWAKSLGYIKDNKSVVLVAGVLNESNSRIAGSRSEYKDKLQAILGGLGENDGADVLALYVDDSSVKDKADSNGLSLGRELLREFAEQNNVDLHDDDIRGGRITDLLDKIGDDAAKCMPVVTPQPTQTPEPTEEPTASPTEEPTATPTEEPAATPTAEPTVAPTEAPTQQPTPAPTEKPVISGIACKAVDGAIKLTWPKAGAGDGKFLYYKIVFSVKDATPEYPGSGYVKAIDNINTLSATIKPYSVYSGGDVGGKIKPGVSYYVSVTYVYEKGTFRGNAVRVKCPAPPPDPTPAPTAAPSAGYTVSAYASGDHIHIKWDKAPTSSGFVYYKVVLSKGDSSPKYPDNGYLCYFSDIDQTQCDANPGDCYNGGDICGDLKAGETYYISVTYVYDDYKKYGTVKRVKMPGTLATEAPPAAFASPTCSATLDGNEVAVTWKKLPASTVSYGGKTYQGFKYYKVALARYPDPKYPDHCEAATPFGIGTGSARICIDGYDPDTWYVAVTYVFDNGSFNSPDDSFVIPAPTEEPTPTPESEG